MKKNAFENVVGGHCCFFFLRFGTSTSMSYKNYYYFKKKIKIYSIKHLFLKHTYK